MISCGPPIASLRSTTTELANWITSFGTGTIWILKNSGGTFSPVYHQGDPGTGIGGFDLMRPSNRAFAFDYDGTGKLDHLVLYRPGTGTIWILKNSGGAFSPMYHQGDPGTGIGGYDVKSPADRAVAFDYDSTGKRDHLALYRPGTGTMWILKKNTQQNNPQQVIPLATMAVVGPVYLDDCNPWTVTGTDRLRPQPRPGAREKVST